MAEERFIVPGPKSDFIALSRSTKGRLFKKHILTKGDLIHPVTKKIIKIDDDFLNAIQTNFENKACDIVQVPLAGPNNEHSEAPDRNIGEVVRLERSGDKLYAVMDIRKHAEDVGSTLLGASAMFSQNYEDTRTGKKVGPTLIHTCVTNRPYVLNLDDYEEIVAASNIGGESPVLLTAASTEENPPMELDALLDTLLTEHGINVAELQAKATAGEAATQLSNALTTALKDSDVIKLSNGEQVSGEDIVSSVVELAETNVALSARLETLERKDAAHAVDELIGQGRVLPAQRETYIDLKLSNPELFDKLVPEKPFVKLSNEEGFIPDEPKPNEDIDAEIARLTAAHNSSGMFKA
jgi:hypothetical protein